MSASRQRPAAVPAAHTADEIYEKIYIAVLEHRLHPGTKLAEGRLATIFGTSRARVREALTRLAYEKIVDQIPQRGSFIARPSAEQAKDVFAARRLIEPAVLSRLIDTATPDTIARLREHQQREIDARQRNDRSTVIRLTGEFHQLLAELAGNTILARNMRELTVLTCLIIFLYNAPMATSCRADEHFGIIDAIEAHDTGLATQLMLTHLNNIEASLTLGHRIDDPDLEAIFEG